MTTDVCRIIQDRRPVRGISTIDLNGSDWTVGRAGITKIEPYEEPGWGSRITWFAVYAGAEIQNRVPAHAVTVWYGTVPA